MKYEAKGLKIGFEIGSIEVDKDAVWELRRISMI